ncbi:MULTISPECIES: hypothetical protein [Streptomyces]
MSVTAEATGVPGAVGASVSSSVAPP